jgi:cell shape-determining protein MreC
VSRRYPVNNGDIVETSSLSTLVPPGIVIGFVSKASEASGNIFQKVDVQPAVDLSSMSAAFVMHYTRPAGAVDLEKKAVRNPK